MTKWAYIENNEIKGTYDKLPTSWRNISGLNTLEYDLDYLTSLGWHKIDTYTSYDSNIYSELGYTFELVNGLVVGTPILQEKTTPAVIELEDTYLTAIRAKRDRLLYQSDIYQLGDWQIAFDLSLKTRWLLYRASLRDVPQIYLTSGSITWPAGLNELIDDSNTSMSTYLSSLLVVSDQYPALGVTE